MTRHGSTLYLSLASDIEHAIVVYRITFEENTMDSATVVAWRKAINRILSDIDYLVLATPTSDLRSKLTEINIKLLYIEKQFKQEHEVNS